LRGSLVIGSSEPPERFSLWSSYTPKDNILKIEVQMVVSQLKYNNGTQICLKYI